MLLLKEIVYKELLFKILMFESVINSFVKIAKFRAKRALP